MVVGGRDKQTALFVRRPGGSTWLVSGYTNGRGPLEPEKDIMVL
jgi:hypothetical protein